LIRTDLLSADFFYTRGRGGVVTAGGESVNQMKGKEKM
jgi:hypothetical protein